MQGEGTWVLSESFNTFLGRVLHDQKALPSEGRVAMLRLLAFGASNDDIVLILHSDRKDHLVMNYAQTIDKMPIKEQEACALFVSLMPTDTYTYRVGLGPSCSANECCCLISKILEHNIHNPCQ